MIKRVLCVILAVVLTVGMFSMVPIHVSAVPEMTASEKCMDYLKSMESFSAVPFWDYSQWTVGFGNRCPDEDLERYKKEGIPMDEAEALFAKQLAGFAREVVKFTKKKNLTLTQNQFDALVCLSYNKGGGWLYTDNALVQALVKGDTSNTFIAEMTTACAAGGKFLSGLMRRRLTEVNMFLNGVYSLHVPENYCYVVYDAGEGKSDRIAQGYDCNLYAVPLATATYSGYTFLGWYTAPDGGVKVTVLDENTNEMTLYAHWEKGFDSGDSQHPSIPEGAVKVKVTGDIVNVRTGPGISYSIATTVTAGTTLGITNVKHVNGEPWGKCEQGWICLNYTDYKEDSVKPEPPVQPEEDKLPKLPFYATVVGVDTLPVYNGPHGSYPKVATLKRNDRIQIVELYTLFGVLWGRCESGWVRIDRNLLVEISPLLAHSFQATITNQFLKVRSGPGTQYTHLDTLYRGHKLTILSVELVDGVYWGRFSNGWICLSDYTDFNSSKLPQYEAHRFSEWKLTKAPTCAEEGEETRVCSICGGKEVRKIPKLEHKFGEWKLTKAPTCTEEGEETRICSVCGQKEVRKVSKVEHKFGKWEQTKAPTCTVKGEEVRKCRHCGHSETREIPVTDHDYGEWYVVKKPTYTEKGIERRDCKHCKHYETREIPSKSDPVEKVFGTLVGNSYLNIRKGVGSKYEVVGRLAYGERVEILEQVNYSKSVWGRIDRGWICLTGYMKLETVMVKPDGPVTEPETKTYGTLTGYHFLNIRAGAGSHNKLVGKLNFGDRVEILEQVKVGNDTWGRIQQGWICLTGYMTLETVPNKPAEPEVPEVPDVSDVPDAPETTEKVFATVTCSVLNIRAGAGIKYDIVGAYTIGERVEILEQKKVGKDTWGRTVNGWICLTGLTELETVPDKPVKPGTTEKVFATITCAELNIRAGTGTGYDKLGVYKMGDRVEILEKVAIGNGEWGRTEKGWIYLTGYTKLETVTVTPDKPDAKPVTKTYGTLTGYHFLNIRAGAGSGHKLVGKLNFGDRVEILEQVKVGNDTWGRIRQGWICLTGYMTLETVTE